MTPTPHSEHTSSCPLTLDVQENSEDDLGGGTDLSGGGDVDTGSRRRTRGRPCKVRLKLMRFYISTAARAASLCHVPVTLNISTGKHPATLISTCFGFSASRRKIRVSFEEQVTLQMRVHIVFVHSVDTTKCVDHTAQRLGSRSVPRVGRDERCSLSVASFLTVTNGLHHA